MNVTSEILSVVKKAFLISDELTRLSADLKELTGIANNHEVRLAVIENTLALTRYSSKLILPGK